MKNIEELRRMLNSNKEELRQIYKRGQESADGLMTTEDETREAVINADNIKLDKQIELAEKRNKLEMDNANPSSLVPEIISSEKEKRFENMGDMLLAVRNSTGKGVAIDKRFTEARTASGMNTISPADGGFLVEPEVSRKIMQKAYAVGNILSRCEVINLGAAANGFTWPELEEDSRKDGFRYGGIEVKWVGEGMTVDVSSPKFKKRSLDLSKIMGFVPVTREQLEDSVGLGSYIENLVPKAMAFAYEDSILNGTGVGMPLGILNSPVTIEVKKRAGQVANTIVYENLVDMRARFDGIFENAVFVINREALPQLDTMALAVGTGGVPVYMPASGASGKPYDTLFGRPVIISESAQVLGTKGDIILADFSQYRLIEKGGIDQTSSMHVLFMTDELLYRFTQRSNGAPVWSKAVTPKNGTKTISPFITLETRS